jgi:hypothetical protein
MTGRETRKSSLSPFTRIGLSVYKNPEGKLDGFAYLDDPQSPVDARLRFRHNGLRIYYDGVRNPAVLP